uniref:Putative wd40 domain protein n=1 Tax=Ixodes ricinus TaxID=34613 RepID=A0A131Y209_IXORI
MSDLEHFRTEWLSELKDGTGSTRRSDRPGGSDTSDVSLENETTSPASNANKGNNAHAGPPKDHHFISDRNRFCKQAIKLESNTACQGNPRAFEIADRLLQGEILTDDDLYVKRGKKRGDLGNNQDDHAERRQMQKVTKRHKHDSDRSLLDTFISDLNEIDEIPFFDICLPREVAINIFRHLNIVDLCRCAQVSRSWRSIADDELLWHRHSREMGFADDVVAMEKAGWKRFLRDQMQRESVLRHNWKNRIGRLYELEYSRAGVLSAVDSSDAVVVAGYSSGEVRLWHRTCDGLEVETLSVDGVPCADDSGHVSSVALSKSHAIVAYARGEVCVADLGAPSLSAATPCRQLLSLPGPAHVTASQNDDHFVAFGGTHVVLVDPSGRPRPIQLSTKVSHVKLVPSRTGARHPCVVSAADDAVRLHAGDCFEVDGVTLHHMIGATVTCVDATEGVVALGVTDRTAVHVFQVPLYATESAKLLGTLTSHTSSVLCVNVSSCPDNLVLTGSCDKNARIFDVRTLQCEVRISAHGLGVTQVQMDEHSLVTGGQDGLVCVWDLRSKAKLWEMFCRHPVRHLRANATTLVTAHLPQELFPEPEDGNVVVHARQRGSIRVYDFTANQHTSGIPSICLSSYDEPAGYNYNVRLAVPYDDIVEI